MQSLCLFREPLDPLAFHFQLPFSINQGVYEKTLKPIFHCDAKLLGLGTFASPNAKDSTFALPNSRNTNMLVSLALGDADFLLWPCTFLFLCVYFICIG